MVALLFCYIGTHKLLIIVIYKYNGVRRTKWVEFKKEFLVGVIFLFYFIRKTLYTDVGAFLKISIVNISCTNK